MRFPENGERILKVTKKSGNRGNHDRKGLLVLRLGLSQTLEPHKIESFLSDSKDDCEREDPRVGEVIARSSCEISCVNHSWVTVDYRFLLWKFWKFIFC